MAAPDLLRGRRVLVVGSSNRPDEVAEQLASHGAEVLALQALDLVPPESFAPLDAALDRLNQFGWLVFTSRNALVPFFTRLASRGLGLADLGHLRLAAIGTATAEALKAHGRPPDLVPAKHAAEDLADAMAPLVVGSRVLLPRALVAREVLPARLLAAGALEVCSVPVYRAVLAGSDPEPVRQALVSGLIDAVVFSSAGTVRAVLDLLGGDGVARLARCQVVCIGPVTAAACFEAGLTPIIAERSTRQGLVETLVALLAPKAP